LCSAGTPAREPNHIAKVTTGTVPGLQFPEWRRASSAAFLAFLQWRLLASALQARCVKHLGYFKHPNEFYGVGVN